MPPVDLSTKTITRLQRHAVPLVDTFDTVIAKLLDAYEKGPQPGVTVHQARTTVQVFDPAAPPNLSHTSVKYISLCGVVLPPSETYWNPLVHAVIRRVAATGLSTEDIKREILANTIIGRKEEDGYKYLSDLGISVQGQDANGAWKTAYRLASRFNLPLDVTFAWQDNPRAALPNVTGSFTVRAA